MRLENAPSTSNHFSQSSQREVPSVLKEPDTGDRAVAVITSNVGQCRSGSIAGASASGILDVTLLRPRIMASHHPTTAVAEGDQPVRILGYQRSVEPASDVEPRHALSLRSR